MPFLVRSRNEGRTYELRVKHSRLPKTVYHTFDVHEDAQRPSVPAYRRWRRLIGARPRHGCSVPSAVLSSRSRRRSSLIGPYARCHRVPSGSSTQ
jgi:hypothetical protein